MVLKSAVFFFALSFATALPAAPATRAPTGNWNVNFADAQCIAQRDYGTPANELKLVLKATAVGDVMQVAAVRTATRAPAAQVGSTVQIEGRQALKTNLLMYSLKDSKNRVYLLNMPSAEFESIRNARTLSLQSTGLSEVFQLSQMEPLLKVMNECVADLRRVYNIGANGADPAAFRSRARTNIARLFSSDDYPGVAIEKDQSGRVGFVLLIGEDGRVADCTIVSTSGVPALDSQACALLKIRAKFEPARGLDGKPAKDSHTGGIVWRLPG